MSDPLLKPATPFTERHVSASCAHNGSSSIVEAISPSSLRDCRFSKAITSSRLASISALSSRLERRCFCTVRSSVTCLSLATRALMRCWAWLGTGIGRNPLSRAKRAIILASIRSVFSSTPIDSAYCRTLRALVTAQDRPSFDSSRNALRSKPPVASITTRSARCWRQNTAGAAIPAVVFLKLPEIEPGSMQTSSVAFETSTPQMIFITVTCLVRTIVIHRLFGCA